MGCDLVEVPAGEGKKSFEWHKMGLDTLHAKFIEQKEQLSRQDAARVEQLMELSYAMLQQFHKCPYLQYYEHVSKYILLYKSTITLHR